MTGAEKPATLRRQSEIRQLFRRGARKRGRFLDVVVLARPQGPVRALYVTSRKVGGAVERNRVRRRLREAFRELGSDLRGGMDVGIVASPKAAGAAYADLLHELERSLVRLGAIASAEPQ